MSPVGLTKDAGWEIGVSRTLPVGPEAVWEALVSDPAVAVWLGELDALPTAKGDTYRTVAGTTGEVRSFHPGDRIRLTYQPPGRTGRPTTLQVAVSPGRSAAGTSTVLRFHHEHLAGAGEREAMRAHWSAVLDRLGEVLGWR